LLLVCSTFFSVSSSACVTNCANFVAKPCGPDGCGGSCGSCATNEVCQPLDSEPSAAGFQYSCQATNGTCTTDYTSFNDRVGSAPSKNSDLAYCNQYKDKTCCTQGYTQTILPQSSMQTCLYKKLGSSCFKLLSLNTCVKCHPDVGTGAKTFIPCKTYCDKIWNACKGAKLKSSTDVTPNPNDTFIFPGSGDSISSRYASEGEFFSALANNQNSSSNVLIAFPDITGCQYYYDANTFNDPDQTICFSGGCSVGTSVVMLMILLLSCCWETLVLLV